MTDIATLTAGVEELRSPETCDACEGSGKTHFFEKDEQCYSCKGVGKKKPYWPRVVTGLKVPDQDEMCNAPHPLSRHEPGQFVAVKPCREDKTFLGIYLGDFASGMTASIGNSGELKLSYGFGNPAIWVPDLKRIVRGNESWWGGIKGPDHLRQITGEDIENVWYVQALKAMTAGPTPETGIPVTE